MEDLAEKEEIIKARIVVVRKPSEMTSSDLLRRWKDPSFTGE